MHAQSSSDALVARVRGKYGEMPGLRLTFAQACRLWQMDAAACQAVLEVLIVEGFLVRTTDGVFIAMPTTQRGTTNHPPTPRQRRSA